MGSVITKMCEAGRFGRRTSDALTTTAPVANGFSPSISDAGMVGARSKHSVQSWECAMSATPISELLRVNHVFQPKHLAFGSVRG